MKNKDLSNQISATYKMLRLGVAVIAFAFPLLLWVGGHLFAGLPLAGSMSAYYYSVMRDTFVGILFAVGVILFVYQGYTRFEDWALNLAGGLALGIALFPMAVPSTPSHNPFSLHGVCAVSFFLCIAYVCIFRASDTLSLMHHAATIARYRRWYKFLGYAMVALPVIAWILISSVPGQKSAIFAVELVGIYVFAMYWVIKSHEVSQTDSDRKAARGKLRVEPHGLSAAVRTLPITSVDDQNPKR
jgi:hypothetical protein